MRLTTEQIRALSVGAVRVFEAEDGIHFSKFTEKQTAAYYALSNTLGQRADTTTGVRLDFETDSKTLRFGVSSGGRYEIWLNGVLRYKLHPLTDSESHEAEVALTDTLGNPCDTVRVTLCFPSHSCGVLTFLELDDGASFERHRFDRKLLFIGDSITQGYNSHYDTLSYAYRVSRMLNADSVIQGVGGAFFHESTFDLPAFDPDTVVVAFGTNDFGRCKTMDELRDNARAFLAPLAEAYRGKRVYVIAPIWRGVQEKPMGGFRDAQRIPLEVAKELGLNAIDGLSLTPPLSEFYAGDDLHPDSQGFSLFAEALLPHLL